MGAQKSEIGREDVTDLLNNVWYTAVIEFGCVSSRILSIKFTFALVKTLYIRTEGDDEERKRFLNDMDSIL